MHAKQRKHPGFTGQLMIADFNIDAPRDNKKEKRAQGIIKTKSRLNELEALLT